MVPAFDPMEQARCEIGNRIGLLAAGAGRFPLQHIVARIDDIRCLARDNGFAVVETLASHLESAIGSGGRSATILTYLDAMSDAALDIPGGSSPARQEAWLASVAVRLNG